MKKPALHLAITLACMGVGFCTLGVASAQTRVEGVAASVGAPDALVLLRSDVEFRARAVLTGARDVDVTLAPVRPAALRTALDELVAEVLLAREAKRVRVAEPSADDRRIARVELITRAGGPERFMRLVGAVGVTQAEIDALVDRRAWAAAFLRANLRGAADISDAEADVIYEASAHADSALSPEAARDLIRAERMREATLASVIRWVRILRERTPVRIFARY